RTGHARAAGVRGSADLADARDRRTRDPALHRPQDAAFEYDAVSGIEHRGKRRCGGRAAARSCRRERNTARRVSADPGRAYISAAARLAWLAHIARTDAVGAAPRLSVAGDRVDPARPGPCRNLESARTRNAARHHRRRARYLVAGHDDTRVTGPQRTRDPRQCRADSGIRIADACGDIAPGDRPGRLDLGGVRVDRRFPDLTVMTPVLLRG